MPKAYAILLAGDNDNSINKYFIMNAFPTENEMNEIVDYIIESPGKGRNKIAEEVGVGQQWGEKMLKYLLVNGDI